MRTGILIEESLFFSFQILQKSLLLQFHEFHLQQNLYVTKRNYTIYYS